jgi:hypothetical protein
LQVQKVMNITIQITNDRALQLGMLAQ